MAPTTTTKTTSGLKEANPKLAVTFVLSSIIVYLQLRNRPDLSVFFASTTQRFHRELHDIEAISSVGKNGSGVPSIFSDLDIEFPREKTIVANLKRKLAFVHVGKTAGSTISLLLRNGCHDWLQTKPCEGRDGTIANETLASFRILSYFHVNPVPFHRFSSFVVTTRNPIHRFISAFSYVHPKNMRKTQLNVLLYRRQRRPYVCFPTLQDFVTAADGHPTFQSKAHIDDQEIDCIDYARQAIFSQEHGDWNEHIYWNYKQYIGQMPPDREVFVIRSEHIWDDWVKLNQLLGSQEDIVIPTENTNMRRYKNMVDTHLTDTAMSTLCQLLREDIRAYLSLLSRAVNLEDQDVINHAKEIDLLCNFTSNHTEHHSFLITQPTTTSNELTKKST